ncbi:MAG: tetratricopeptide repeat protein, partial [Bryobacteraceae bacterium]
ATSLARDELRRGHLAAARRAIAQCRPTQQTPQRELRMIAMVYLENHDLAHALKVAQLAWRAHRSQENLLFTANVLQLQGRYMNVVSLLGKYRHVYGNSPGFLITIGESESDGKLYPAAERDLKRAVALAPESYPAHYVLGHLLAARGDLAGGIQEYRKAISLSPQKPLTYCQLGRALEEKNDIEQARRRFEQAISVSPQYAPAYYEMGKLELRANRIQKAVTNLAHAIQINPASQRSYYLLMQAYWRLGERKKAQLVKQQWTAYKKAHPLLPAGTRGAGMQ